MKTMWAEMVVSGACEGGCLTSGCEVGRGRGWTDGIAMGRETKRDKTQETEKEKKRKVEMQTKNCQEDTSTSAIPQGQAPKTLLSEEKEAPSTAHLFDEGA